jgi:thioredoxin 1
VMVDFYADWCGPCKMVGPVMEELWTEFAGKATIVKVDVDALGEISQEFGVRSIPTVVVFKDGEKVWEPLVGAFPKEQYAGVIEWLVA